MKSSCAFEAEITEESVRSFSRLSGDFNPLHNDPAYAAGTEFGRPISHGALLVGLVSRVLGMHIPGERSLIHSMKVQFPKPLFFPAKVKVEGRLKDFNAERNSGTVAVSVVDAARLWPVCEADVAFGLHQTKGSAEAPAAAAAAPAARTPAAARSGRPRLLVTGGTGGIGAALLSALSPAYDALSLSRRPGPDRETLDVEEPGALEAFLERTSPSGFYGVLHMSSAPVPRGFVSDDLALVRRHLRHSVEVPLLLAQWARRTGSTVRRIVLLGSTYGTRFPKPHLGAYSLGKAALEHLARILTADLAGQGATVNAVLPTVVPVGLNEGMPERAIKSLAGRMPTGRVLESKDIAGVVQFLLSDAAAQVNGACIAVDGGLAD
ncbi:MAG TPA: SDR family oxidoreductase [Elusimicrobiota bacterium]|nr:SDR family oxidoreductase [Elusimicrobiota bacterium]